MIKINDIQWKYKKFSLTIEELTIQHGINILVGHNGSGKSTLLSLLATAKRPSQGEISYHGDTMNSNLLAVRSKIGYVPTGLELYQDFTPVKLLLYLSQLKGLPKKLSIHQTEELLSIFHLRDVQKTKIKRLSQGMQQRLALAQAFLGKPTYIFLDEPLNYLDIHERKSLLNFLSKIAPHTIILVATHELNEWEAICNSVIWMNEGTLQYEGTKTMWKHELPLTIWTGEMEDSLYENFSKKHLIVYAGRIKDKLVVRCANSLKPAPGFKAVAPTMEDAFFIRKHSQQRS
ncbi:ABC transporter ATP-binding protein [Sutcliffiella rhizosphaerae]|uniref:Vitamin B12 import ATP-binding protein BtuD n=1 Tax=Sutcliffiella rhizosphaerae TaxID=2880967 RepID=A0ABN8A9D0_9BACI|nr:ABC transporter ATP-binding protein [Sutcliffiella rhizosphaerae]CAG9621011.1 Vitamin B12 import ATP-binding protein BtuD [Sutcliffiella rhizosphaerae]